MMNYEQLVARISRAGGKTLEEITRLVEAKRAKLSGLISKEGAAQIIAAELGINFDKEKIKIGELLPGIKRVNVVGKIVSMNPVKEYNKNGKSGKIGSFNLADETGNIRIVLWDTNHISLIENREIADGDVVEISNANLRNNEIHLTGFSEFKKSSEIIENVKIGRQFSSGKIADFVVGGSFSTRAFIVQAFEPRFFEVCPVCGSRVMAEADGVRCEKHGHVLPKKRALISIVIDDGSGSIRAVLFSEQIEKLEIKEEELQPAVFATKKNEILGRELNLSGNVRQNKLFNTMEYFVSDVNKIDIENLISELEK